jgi:hypothetical protein
MATAVVKTIVEVTGLGNDKTMTRRFETTLAPEVAEGPSYIPIISTAVTYISALATISINNITGMFITARSGVLGMAVSTDAQTLTVGTPEFARIALNSGESTYLNFYAGITVAKSVACWGLDSAVVEYLIFGTNT